MCKNNLYEFDYRQEIDLSYNFFIELFKSGTKPFLVKRDVKFNAVPGWNTHCRDLYGVARSCFHD